MNYLSLLLVALLALPASALEIIAHRGASHDAPENTLAAFRLGWQQGAEANELDIHQTMDGQIVVIHDGSTKRTTGIDKPVSEQTLFELRLQDAGSWKGSRFVDEPIPTLAEALETMPAGKRTFIEIKCGREVLSELDRVLTASGKRPEQLVIIGFNYDTMAAAKKLLPHLQVYWIVDYKPAAKSEELPKLSELIDKARLAGLDGLDLSWKFPLDRQAVAEVHAQKLQLYTWTVDDAAMAARLVAAGVDGITTNRPQWLREQLAMAQTSVSSLSRKPAAIQAAAAHAEANWPTALKIWGWSEPGYREKKSAAALAEVAQEAGLRVKLGVANIPTAFTAEYGSGKPVIGILGEFDALPELSQEAVPFRKPREGGNGYGHACGHHVFGVASLSATIAIAERIKAGEINGTVRFYMCPAEEGGSAKAFMARDGLFNDCDTVLHWHPGSRNSAGDSTCHARIAAKFRFHGTPAHASGSPERGRSALDALLLTIHAIELMREHTPEGTRLHHVITAGGGAPNVVPEFAEGFFYVRHGKAEVVQKLYPRLLKCAQAGALATETKLEVAYLGGTMEILPNDTLAKVIQTNLTGLNDLSYTSEEAQFAIRLQESFPEKAPPLDDIRRVFDMSGRSGGGSTDVGDVSWVVPVAGFSAACWAPGTPGHSWQAVACGGTTIAKKGMNLAARTLAATAWDLFSDAELRARARAEHASRLDGRKYSAMLEKDQQPPLDYRDPPQRKGGE